MAGTASTAAASRDCSRRSPLHVAADARWIPEGEHLDDAAERVSGGGGLVDGGDHPLPRCLVRAAHRARLDTRYVARLQARLRGDAAERDHVTGDRAPQRRQQRLGDRATGHLGGRLAGTGALDDVADVLQLVEQGAAQIGVARPRHQDALRGLAARGRRLDREHVSPVGRVPVGNEERERRASRPPVTHAPQHADTVLLDALAVAASVPALATSQFGVDRRDVDVEPGRTAVEDGCEARAVRLPGGEIAQSAHAPTLSALRAQVQRASGTQRPARGALPYADGAAWGRPVRRVARCRETHFTITWPACSVSV